MKKVLNIIIKHSEEDEGWIATCSEYPGLSGFGDSKAEAKRELTIAMQAVIEGELENAKKEA